MADVQVSCESCGNVITLSEFADPMLVNCKVCGKKLKSDTAAPPNMQETVSTDKKKGSSLLKKNKHSFKQQNKRAAQEAPEEEILNSWNAIAPFEKKKLKKKRFKMSYLALTWLTFSGIALVMGILRYGDYLFSALHPVCSEFTIISDMYSGYIMAGVLIGIILKASSDSIFHAIPSILPPYAIYYLFFVCDDFVMRAVVGGLLVGIGEDATLKLIRLTSSTMVTINQWLQSGG